MLLLGLLSLALASVAAAQPVVRPHNATGRGARGSAQAAASLDALLADAQGGGSDDVVDAALDALRARADDRATTVLVSLTTHRRLGARRRAYLALGALRTSPARDAVSLGLSDVDLSVRAVCARALGDMGAREALPRLFVAFERGVHDAARSIGALATGPELPRFDAQLGRAPLSAMLEGYGRLVRRADVSWDQKQDTLHRLFEVSGLEVRSFLVQWLRDLPASAPAALRADLDRSIRRIPLRPRARSGPASGPAAAQETTAPATGTTATGGATR